MKKKHCLSIFFIFFIVSCFNVVYADNASSYQIELVVFSHITPQSLAMEQWSSASADFTAPNMTGHSRVLPPSSTLALRREVNDIQQQPGYRIMTHLAWRDHLTSAQKTFTLYNGNLYDSEGNLVARNINAAHKSSFSNALLHGTIAVTLGHYINMRIHLFLIEPVSLLKKLDSNGYFSTLNQPDFVFQLSESRRMRSKELNYFWHPVMGALVKITPLHAKNQAS